MIQIQNITDETNQRHLVVFEQSEIALVLRYHPTVEMWAFDVEYKNRRSNGYKLAAGPLHIRSRNYPFDFVVIDETGQGLDPLRRDDFSTGRCSLYLLEAADMEAIRGAAVEI